MLAQHPVPPVLQLSSQTKSCNAHCSAWRLCRLAAVAAFVAFLGIATQPARGAQPVSPKTTFFHANALYRDGQYVAAAREYEELLHAGLASGNLYFNLGNAYFKSGDKGRAILNYERARLLLPRDPDVVANLKYARSLTGAESCRPPLFERVAFPLARRLTAGGLVWLTSILYTLLLFALTGYRLWPRHPRWLVYLAATLGVLVFFTGASLGEQLLSRDWQRTAVVVHSGDTPARFEPADNGTVHFVLKEGARVRLLDARSEWWQIARCDGRRGWIPRNTLQRLFSKE